MKALKKWLKIIALFFTALILFQSCTTYKTPVSLEQAVQEKKKVKIITTTNDALKYNYIVFEDGQFYGVKADYDTRENVKFPIYTDEVYEVLLNEGGFSTWPTWAWIVFGVLGVGVILGIIYLITASNTNPSPY